VKSKLLVLATATLLAAGVANVTPVSALAAVDSDASDAMTKDLDAKTKDFEAKTRDVDASTKDLDAKLADARARLEQAAHEVAELSSEMNGPLMDRFMVFNGEGPSRAVIGVQLDPAGTKDGARIQEVSPGGAADEAGLHVGDVITAINGTDVKGDRPARQVMHLMRKVEPGAKVNMRISRDGKPRDFVVTARQGMTFLGMHAPPFPPIPPIPPGLPDGNVAFGATTFGPVFIHGPLGEMELATLTPQLGRYFGTEKGVLVVRAPKEFKLEDGDVILAIDGREPSSGSHATRILSSYQPGEKITIKVMRQQKTVNLEATLPEREPFEGPGHGRKMRIMPHKPGNAAA